jgi:hypothetical protein
LWSQRIWDDTGLSYVRIVTLTVRLS